MVSSRDPNDLHPTVLELAKKFKTACLAENINLLITSTYRDAESQNALYALGRTLPGKKVTNAKAGQSFHNFRVAFDVVPLVAGKAIWNDTELWKRVGAIGEGVGLEWGGSWKKFVDLPHFQFTGGLTLADFQSGKSLGE